MIDLRHNCMTRPNWAISLLSFYLQRKILRRKPPLFASFKITYHCNLSCAACPFHLRAGEAHSHMTWDGAIDALDELKARGTQIITFEGGEPLLWRDGKHSFRDVVEYAKKHFFCVTVTTNGILPLAVPADVIWVSIDGLPETHNRLRSNSFERIWSNISSAGNARVLVHFTINRMNWRELEELAQMLKKQSVIKGISVQLFYPYGQG
jgi:MoaA/NifB/PqqE/SkfB family radical SAM enzyme